MREAGRGAFALYNPVCKPKREGGATRLQTKRRGGVRGQSLGELRSGRALTCRPGLTTWGVPARTALQVSNSEKAMKFVRDGTCSGFIAPGKTKPLALALAFARGRRAPQCADNARAQRSALTDEPSPAVGHAEFAAQFQVALPENCLPLGSCGVA